MGGGGGAKEKELVESIELDVESAVVELESTHVRIGPGFT